MLNLTDTQKLDALLELCGHWQDGSCQTVRMGWDDATRMFFISYGKKSYSGSSFELALQRAIENHA